MIKKNLLSVLLFSAASSLVFANDIALPDVGEIPFDKDSVTVSMLGAYSDPIRAFNKSKKDGKIDRAGQKASLRKAIDEKWVENVVLLAENNFKKDDTVTVAKFDQVYSNLKRNFIAFKALVDEIKSEDEIEDIKKKAAADEKDGANPIVGFKNSDEIEGAYNGYSGHIDDDIDGRLKAVIGELYGSLGIDYHAKEFVNGAEIGDKSALYYLLALEDLSAQTKVLIVTTKDEINAANEDANDATQENVNLRAEINKLKVQLASAKGVGGDDDQDDGDESDDAFKLRVSRLSTIRAAYKKATGENLSVTGFKVKFGIVGNDFTNRVLHGKLMAILDK